MKVDLTLEELKDLNYAVLQDRRRWTTKTISAYATGLRMTAAYGTGLKLDFQAAKRIHTRLQVLNQKLYKMIEENRER